ncbi:hypothetical protein D9613_010818 [Agrocybe pediades]|uniref:Uncharacterized protein n=1 Tax=Agrocybe pediades TaxID=84607 RepID=A0A8H4QL22_9AGAR|nr:hypothetical protein D9613_010818 [Agrocybe pediades]
MLPNEEKGLDNRWSCAKQFQDSRNTNLRVVSECFANEDNPWLPNLTSVAFSTAFRTEEVLAALQRMPRLVFLTMDLSQELPRHHRQGPKVVLPNLVMLRAHGDVIPSVSILGCITPSPNLCLSIHTSRLRTGAQETGEYERYENTISPYVLPYFTLNPPSAVAFFLDKDILVLEDLSPLGMHANWVPPRRARVVLSTSFVPSSSLVIQLISSTCLSHISRLELLSGRRQGSVDNLFSETVISALDIFSSSVKTLCTDGDTLKQLLELPLSVTSNLFPCLTALEVNCQSMPPLTEKEDPHHAFVKLRKAAGRPISVLDLGILPTYPGDMSFLEEHAGLLVKWKTGDNRAYKYLCGRGHPERLRFPTYRLRRING